MELDDLVNDCIAALETDDSRPAVRTVLDRATRDANLRAELQHGNPGINVLYNSADLTVLNVVWPPDVTLVPHNHRMWASIGIYTGREENRFFRRDGQGLTSSGGKELDEGDVLLLGDDAIHSVHNPVAAYTGAIHVYGGDFLHEPRSQWVGEPPEETPYDFELIQAEFDRAERAHREAR